MAPEASHPLSVAMWFLHIHFDHGSAVDFWGRARSDHSNDLAKPAGKADTMRIAEQTAAEKLFD